MKRCLAPITARKREVDREIELVNGGRFVVRSADDPDRSLRAAGIDGLVVDEAAFLSEEAWKGSLRPSLADSGGWCLMITTPNGLNWIYQRFSNPGHEWETWQFPTAQNPKISADELASVRAEIGPRRFAQEHEARFLSIAGALWPADYFADSIWLQGPWPDAFEASALALDPSIGASELSDLSAIVFVGLTGGRLFVRSDIARRTPGETLDALIEMATLTNPTAVGIEANGFQAVLKLPLAQKLSTLNRPPLPLHLIYNHERKPVRILRLDPLLANGSLVFARTPDNEVLIEQLQMVPLRGYHDDGPDALEQAVRLLNHVLRADPVEKETVLSAM